MAAAEQPIPPDSPRLASEVMAKARVVALIVHGVGDHTQTNILESLDRGLAEPLPGGSFVTTRLKLGNVMLPSGQLGDTDVMRIQISGEDRFVIPVIWSREHSRAEPKITRYRMMPGQQANPASGLVSLVTFVAPDLFALCVNSFRCIPKSTGIWKIAVAGVSLLILALEIAVVLGLFLFLFNLPHTLATHIGSRRSLAYIIAIGIIPVIISRFFWKLMPLLDLVGDVAFYVGRPEKSREMQTRMLGIIRWAQETAPRADIIVVGHSLGSALVTHSLIGFPRCADSRLLLVTLGSPLPVMARVFSQNILGPDALMKRYAHANSISFWLHLWRDSDWIGRSLRAARNERFAEMPVGNGSHSNYWADSRIWLKVIALLQTLDSGSVLELVRSWQPTELTDREMLEAHRRYNFLRRSAFLACLTIGILGRISGNALNSASAAKANEVLVSILKGLHFANFVFFLPPILVLFLIHADGPPREFLGQLRLTFSLYVFFFKIWFIFMVAFCVLLRIAHLW